VLRHQLIAVEVAVDRRVLVQDRHRDHRSRRVPERVPQVGREIDRGEDLLELDARYPEALAVALEVSLVVAPVPPSRADT
jgi:hypothetical protein